MKAYYEARARHLHGRVIAFDQASTMLDVARHRIPDAAGFARGDALRLPFRDASFERLFAGQWFTVVRSPG